MSAPQGDNNGDGHDPLPNLASLSVNNLSDAQRRLAIAQAARQNATREEIEARGIRPDVGQILRHMNETPVHSFKRSRLDYSTSTPRRIYDSDTDEDSDDDDDLGYPLSPGSQEKYDEDQWHSLLAEAGLQNANSSLLAEFRQLARQRLRMLKQGTADWDTLHRPPRVKQINLIRKLSAQTELIVEVCKHLRPSDIVNLYSISRDFHHTINENMRSSVFAWTRVMAPSSARIYSSPVYSRWFVPDPAGRPVTSDDQKLNTPQKGQAKINANPTFNLKQGDVRLIPGLLWLQMVVNREIRVRDIIATLARMGHRLPEGAHLTLKKVWLTMDASTTQARMILMNNPDFFTNEDLHIAQLFIVKLVLAFNDPIFGPQSTLLMRLMMGQRGLSPLWAFLRGKKYRSVEEVRRLKLRYDVGPEQEAVRGGMPLLGVEVDELGVIHFEGWGTGRDHLMRPDELVPLEAVRRQLDFDTCIDEMLIYGHVDLKTGNSLVPTLDEMYMSDDELSPAHRDWAPLHHEIVNGGCGNVPFATSNWQPKHARKARWKTLTEEEKAAILKQEQTEMDELNDLDGAPHKFQETWATLTHLAFPFMRQRQATDGFQISDPTPAELAALFQHSSPTKEDDDDATDDEMDIDSDSDIESDTHPRPNQPTDPDSDLDLTLDPITPNELERIYAAYRRPHGPHSESGSEKPMPSSGESSSASEGEDNQERDDEDDDSDEENEEDEEGMGGMGGGGIRGLPIPAYPPAVPVMALFTPATSVGTDDMLLAQADLEYSDDEEEEEEDEGYYRDDEGGGGGEMVGSGGIGGGAAEKGVEWDGDGMDWDHFLQNPGAYAVEGDEEEDEGGVANAQPGEGDDEGGEGGDSDGNGNGGGQGAGGAGGVDNNQNGQQQGQGQGQGQEPEDDKDDELAQYIADEDVGEDGRTKKLRDWFRPW